MGWEKGKIIENKTERVKETNPEIYAERVEQEIRKGNYKQAIIEIDETIKLSKKKERRLKDKIEILQAILDRADIAIEKKELDKAREMIGIYVDNEKYIDESEKERVVYKKYFWSFIDKNLSKVEVYRGEELGTIIELFNSGIRKKFAVDIKKIEGIKEILAKDICNEGISKEQIKRFITEIKKENKLTEIYLIKNQGVNILNYLLNKTSKNYMLDDNLFYFNVIKTIISLNKLDKEIYREKIGNIVLEINEKLYENKEYENFLEKIEVSISEYTNLNFDVIRLETYYSGKEYGKLLEIARRIPEQVFEKDILKVFRFFDLIKDVIDRSEYNKDMSFSSIRGGDFIWNQLYLKCKNEANIKMNLQNYFNININGLTYNQIESYIEIVNYYELDKTILIEIQNIILQKILINLENKEYSRIGNGIKILENQKQKYLKEKILRVLNDGMAINNDKIEILIRILDEDLNLESYEYKAIVVLLLKNKKLELGEKLLRSKRFIVKERKEKVEKLKLKIMIYKSLNKPKYVFEEYLELLKMIKVPRCEKAIKEVYEYAIETKGHKLGKQVLIDYENYISNGDEEILRIINKYIALISLRNYEIIDALKYFYRKSILKKITRFVKKVVIPIAVFIIMTVICVKLSISKEERPIKARNQINENNVKKEPNENVEIIKESEENINIDENEPVINNNIDENEEKSEIENNNFKKVDKKIKDLNGDGKNEIITILTKGELPILEEVKMVILDLETNKVLQEIPIYSELIEIEEIVDINKDGISEILLNCSGGNSYPKPNLYVFNKKLREYELKEIGDTDVNIKNIDNFKILITPNKGREKEHYISNEYKNNLITQGIYNKEGKVIGNSESYYALSEGEIRDSDNDGELELVVNAIIYGVARANIECEFEIIYNLNSNGEIVLNGVV